MYSTKRSNHRLAGLASLIVTAGLLWPAAAQADLKLCNATTSRIGIAIGYQDPKATGDAKFATEGWWNIGAGACETLIRGPVPGRFIYVHAVDYDRSGEWTGTNIMCTADRTFAIKDVKDCQKRGYKSTGFYEVDTGDAKEWTIRLGEPDQSKQK